MRDPHVVCLRYRLITDPSLIFENPPPIERETNEFRMRLADGAVTFEMKEHYASVALAKRIVADYIRAWEIDIALRFSRAEVEFSFDSADIIDRDPPPPGTVFIDLDASAVGIATAGQVRVILPRKLYPEPPAMFQVTPDVETLWTRYEQYLDGKEHLQGMAYFCYTVAEGRGPKYGRGHRYNRAGKVLQIDDKILNTLSKLSSTRGDKRTARKVDAVHQQLDDTERAWLEAAVKLLVRRFAELPYGTQLPLLTMNDLPPL